VTKKKDDSSKVKKIALLVGSLSKTSLSQSLAKYLIATAPETLTFEIIDIGSLSLYNEDLDESPPASWTQFRRKLKNFDGFLFVTPEINNSMPAALKNAIDIASRPFGENVFDSKPGAIVSIYSNPANLAGAGPHLRQSLIFFKSSNHATTRGQY